MGFEDLVGIMQRGGPVMWAILLVSVAAGALVLERSYILYIRMHLYIDRLYGNVIELLENDASSRALELCSAHERHPFGAIAKAALMQARAAAADLERTMQAAALRSLAVLSRNTGLLITLANVVTLLGLLGTVMGLIEAFRGLAEADVVAKQEILAKGISVAMLTTAFGLASAIPTLLCQALLAARQEQLALQVDAKATELLGYLLTRRTEPTP